MTVEIEDSVLNYTKKNLGINADDRSFDLDILTHINAAIFTLKQLGVDSRKPMVIDESDTYSDLFGCLSPEMISEIKMYMVCKTKLGFDSSTMSGAVVEVMKEMIKESEWRLNVAAHATDD